jgi:sulfane dehydrogenase subunit SoxC
LPARVTATARATFFTIGKPEYNRHEVTQVSKSKTRRKLLQIGAALGGGLIAKSARAENAKLGIPLGPYSDRSPYEKAIRWQRPTTAPETGSSSTPLADSVGTLTPSSLHYERHHSGVPNLDPAHHRLVIHGMVERPISLSVAEIKRLPSVSRTLVLECGGNSGAEWNEKTAPDVQRSHGLVSCSEWTGVPLPLLLGKSA